MIERAKTHDIPALVEFIRAEWKSDHVFVQSPSFFQYQYEDEFGNLNFFVSRDSNHDLTGILGFMNYGSNPTGGDIFLSLWKVKATGDPTLGLKLLERLKSDLSPRGLYCTGINKNTFGIYKYLGYRTGSLHRYALLNPDIADRKIIQAPAAISTRPIKSDCRFRELTNQNEILNLLETTSPGNHPKKSSLFFKKRFLNHPVYSYRFWLLEPQASQLLVVTREISALGRKALRLVDLQGDHSHLPRLAPHLLTLMKNNGYEYTELTFEGLSTSLVEESGFIEAKDETIMPGYFEPFERKNVDIHYFSARSEGFTLFLGDGDQDRPNQIGPKRGEVGSTT